MPDKMLSQKRRLRICTNFKRKARKPGVLRHVSTKQSTFDLGTLTGDCAQQPSPIHWPHEHRRACQPAGIPDDDLSPRLRLRGRCAHRAKRGTKRSQQITRRRTPLVLRPPPGASSHGFCRTANPSQHAEVPNPGRLRFKFTRTGRADFHRAAVHLHRSSLAGRHVPAPAGAL